MRTIVLIFMKYAFLPCFILLSTALQALMLSEPDVQAVIDQNLVQENQPLQGMVSITHEKTDAIDPNSFIMEGHKLDVELDREVEISPSSPIIVSFYRFKLSGQPAGLYELPEVKVKVGNKTYSSIPSTYTVKKIQVAPPPPQNVSSKKESPLKASLKLQLEIKGTPLLYPKQRFQVIYKYLFNTNIELTSEKLPLLDPPEFKKVGSKATKEYQENDLSVQQISQTLEAVTPGAYSYGPSQIQGRAYTTDYLGKRIYQQPLLESTMPPQTLHVVAFPAENKPPSFNEAIGPFNLFKVSLASPSKIHIGDKILLNIEIGGDGQIDNVPLPDLCCQPGFSGIFQQSDLPPSEQVVDNRKYFKVEMRPLTALVHDIPSVLFSFFVPETGKYGTLKSDPIPIEIVPLQENTLPETPSQTSPPASHQPFPNWRQSSTSLPSIEIIGNWKLSAQDLFALPLGSWWVFIIIPLGIVLVAGEIKLKRYLMIKRSKQKTVTSQDYFEEAISKSNTPSIFYEGMIKAFMLALKEKNIISSETILPEMLQQEGIQGEIRDYLLSLEHSLFGGGPKWERSKCILKARELFKKLK